MPKPSIKPIKAGRDCGLHVQLGGRATSVINPETQNPSGGLGWREGTIGTLDQRWREDIARSCKATVSRSGPDVVQKKYPEYRWGVDGNPFDWIKQASAQIREANTRERISRQALFVKVKIIDE